MTGWNVPSNNFGQETGLNDAGIETFKGSPFQSLAREIGQNSGDAALSNSGRPVEVHFDLMTLPINKFPSKDAFISILNQCKLFWRANAKTSTFFKKALSAMGANTMTVLKISDYNTTGLLGSDQEHGTDWHNLIKSVGASDKGATSGGSFGIGKHAPFACSQIRTVFYGTKDVAGKTAFQGVAKLVTHKSSTGDTTQGTGYYGHIEKNLPITDYNSLEPCFVRDQVGTDIFVMGLIEAGDWAAKIIKSVLENFFVSIMEQKLIVHVGDVAINHSSLPALLDKYVKDDPDCLSAKYWKSLSSTEAYHFVEDDFCDMGKIELFILPEKDAPKRVAMVRATGMKVFDKGHFQTPMKFSGIFLAKGDGINAFLRSIEPPSHNAWEHERHEDPDLARGILKKLYSWINEKVKSISLPDENTELDVESMSQYLPDDLDDSPLPGSNEPEGEKGAPKEVEILSGIASKETTQTTKATVSGDVDEYGTIDGRGTTKNDSSGGNPPLEAGGGHGEGEGRGQNQDEAKKPSFGRKPIKLRHVRIYCSDPDAAEYRVVFEPEADGPAMLALKIVGEVGEDPAPIKLATVKNSGQILNIPAEGQIGPINLVRGQKSILQVVLSESLHCALEVSAHAN